MAIDKNLFYQQYAKIAIEEQIKYGIPASVTLAQMGFESSFGTSKLAKECNNFFGIKKGSSWTGPVSYHLDDHQYKEPFRMYPNAKASVDDHSKVLLQERYQRICGNKSPLDYKGWAYGIAQGGYASSESYAADLIGEIEHYHLEKYDQLAVQIARQRNLQIGYAKTNVNRSSQVASQLALPIDFQNLKVTGMFHEDRGDHLHGGIDIATGGKNLPVYATESGGKVVSACNGKNSGNMVKVEYAKPDGSKLQCIYMHLSSIGVKVGDTVNAGQVIGVSGNTGRSSGPHLHFETKMLSDSGKWEAFDPVQYLAAIEGKTGNAIPLLKNGQDLLAGLRNQYQPMQAQPYQADNSQRLLANITGSNDPTKWLSYLMNQNGEGGQDSSKDAFSELISTLFSAALVVAARIKISEMLSAVNKEAKLEAEQNEIQEDNTVKRSREKIDVSQLQVKASTIFETECPEKEHGLGLKQA